jgi:hypothetical protein
MLVQFSPYATAIFDAELNKLTTMSCYFIVTDYVVKLGILRAAAIHIEQDFTVALDVSVLEHLVQQVLYCQDTCEVLFLLASQVVVTHIGLFHEVEYRFPCAIFKKSLA